MGRGSAKSKRPSGYRAAYLLWAKSHRVAMIVLETVAGMAIVAGVALGVFLWHLSSGDISLSFLTEPIERAVNARLPGYTVRIKDTVLQKTGAGAGISVRLKSLRLLDAAGNAVAEAPKAAVGIRILPLLLGQITPHSFDLIGPRVAILFDPEGRIVVNMAAPDAAQPDRPGEQAGAGAGENDTPRAAQATSAGQTIALIKALLSGGGGELAGLDQIGIRDASVFFAHQQLGRSWEISRGSILLTRDGGALHIDAEASLNYKGMEVPVRGSAGVQATGDGVEISGRIDDVVPRLLAENFQTLGALSVFDLPVSANYTGKVLDDGTVVSASLAASVGAGHLRPAHAAETGILVDEGSLRLNYDRQSHTVTVEPSQFLSGNTRINLAGRIVGIQPQEADEDQSGAAPALWRFAFEGRDILLGSPDLRQQPLPVERMAVSGQYDLASGELQVEKGEVLSGEGNVSLTASVRPAEGSPQIEVRADLTPMSIRAFKMVWPSFAAPGAYRWVHENIRSGRVAGGTIRASFPAGLMDRIEAGEKIPDDALRAEFAIEDITSSYLREMPYIRGGSGKGTITGNRFELKVDGGHVALASGKRLELLNGYMRIPDIADPAPPGEIGFDIAGPVPGLLELLDHDPLGYPGDLGIKPADFGGAGEVRLRLGLPLVENVKLDDVTIKADAELSKFTGKGVFAGHDVADGVLLLKVADDVLTADGEVLVDKQPAKVVWRYPFTASKNDPSRFVVGMVLDDEGRKKFGLDIPYVSGPVRFEFEPGGAFGGAADKAAPTRVLADLKAAAVMPTPFGWSKPAGVPGDLAFEAQKKSSGEMVLDKLSYDGDGARVRGQIVLNKSQDIESARLPVFNLHSGDDMALLADRVGKRKLQVTLKGTSFNAGALIESTLSLGDGGETQKVDRKNGQQVVLDAEIGKVTNTGGDYLGNARASMVAIDGWVSALDIGGQLNGKSPFRVSLGTKSPGNARVLRIDAGDAGAVLRLANFYSRAEGGDFILLADIPEEASAATTGLLKISKFRIHNEPVLSTIDTAARAKARLSAENPGSASTYFDQLRVPFRSRPGVFQLGESVLRGPSIGATIGGTIDFANRQVALNGTFIPAYGLNNMISRVPVLGQVLVGSKDDGLVALNFSVQGATSSPNVIVNPLSVVTPGILRKVLFELGRLPAYAGPDRPGTDNTGSVNLPSWPVEPR